MLYLPPKGQPFEGPQEVWMQWHIGVSEGLLPTQIGGKNVTE